MVKYKKNSLQCLPSLQHCFGKFGQWDVIAGGKEEGKQRKEENKYIKLFLYISKPFEGYMLVCTLTIQ